MKYRIYLLLITALLAVNGAAAQFRSDRDLAGIWEGNQLRVEIMSNNRVTLLLNGEPKQEGTYRSDFFSKPARLQLNFDNKGQKVTIRCIIEFTDNNTIRWEAFEKGDYPAAFSSDALTLRRKH